MSGTTARGLRYPTGTDPLAGIDENVANLAADVEALSRVGSGTLPVVSVNTAYSLNVTFATPFPAGVTPVVTANALVASPAGVMPVTIASVSNTGFTLWCGRTSGSANIPFNYVAFRT